MGYPAYKSVLDIKDDIDHIVIIILAKFVPRVLEECEEKGIKAITIISAGFSEIGDRT